METWFKIFPITIFGTVMQVQNEYIFVEFVDKRRLLLSLAFLLQQVFWTERVEDQLF